MEDCGAVNDIAAASSSGYKNIKFDRKGHQESWWWKFWFENEDLTTWFGNEVSVIFSKFFPVFVEEKIITVLMIKLNNTISLWFHHRYSPYSIPVADMFPAYQWLCCGFVDKIKNQHMSQNLPLEHSLFNQTIKNKTTSFLWDSFFNFFVIKNVFFGLLKPILSLLLFSFRVIFGTTISGKYIHMSLEPFEFWKSF